VPRRPVDDEPTESLPTVPSDGGEAPPDVDEPAGTPRRRRQLGTSATERPASSYRPSSTGGKTPRSGRRRRPSFWRELPILIVVALVLTFLIQTFLAKVYVIPSGSMETTLHGCTGCVNDRVLVDKVTYRFRDPQAGDVVVFRGPDSWRSEFTVEEPANPVVRGLQGLGSLIGLAPPDEKDFVKRVIAVGGQTVACCDPRNRVLVDDQPLDEPYIYYLPEAGATRQAPFGPVTVPAGELWMMGDSRNNSADSRVPGHGAVPIANVIGQARLIVMPFDRFGTVAVVDPQTDAVGLAAATAPGAPPVLALLAAVPLLRRPRPETFLALHARPPFRRRRGT
jgi:signal peptidase I